VLSTSPTATKTGISVLLLRLDPFLIASLSVTPAIFDGVFDAINPN
jgi:hypothetical protein